MSILEPVGLAEIAAHIRDADLVDMKVCEVGTAERVVIGQLNIGRDKDEVVVRQKWLGVRHGDESEPMILNESYTFDAEDIMWLRATEVGLEDVKPLVVERATDQFEVGAKRIIDEIIRTQVFLDANLTEDALRHGDAPQHRWALRARQRGMWLAYAMTDESPSDICKLHFGYRSQQPLITVSEKIHWAVKNGKGVHHRESVGQWLKGIRATAALIDTHFGTKYRRQKAGWKTHL